MYNRGVRKEGKKKKMNRRPKKKKRSDDNFVPRGRRGRPNSNGQMKMWHLGGVLREERALSVKH